MTQRSAEEVGAENDAVAVDRTMVLSCPDCGREVAIEREDTDPPLATRAVLQCDQCDDGDRHAPEFFGQHGVWVHPTEHLAVRALITQPAEDEQS